MLRIEELQILYMIITRYEEISSDHNLSYMIKTSELERKYCKLVDSREFKKNLPVTYRLLTQLEVEKPDTLEQIDFNENRLEKIIKSGNILEEDAKKSYEERKNNQEINKQLIMMENYVINHCQKVRGELVIVQPRITFGEYFDLVLSSLSQSKMKKIYFQKMVDSEPDKILFTCELIPHKFNVIKKYYFEKDYEYFKNDAVARYELNRRISEFIYMWSIFELKTRLQER